MTATLSPQKRYTENQQKKSENGSEITNQSENMKNTTNAFKHQERNLTIVYCNVKLQDLTDF